MTAPGAGGAEGWSRTGVQFLRIPDFHPANTANGSHGHWAHGWRQRMETKGLVGMLATVSGWRRVDGKARLEIVYVFPRKYRVDTDNLYARSKAVCDGLKRFLIDDSTDWLDLVVRAEVRRGVKCLELTLAPAGEEGD